MRGHGLWYLENGYLGKSQTKALAKLEQALYAKVRPNAQAFTQAFAVPDAVLKTPKKAPKPQQKPQQKPPAP